MISSETTPQQAYGASAAASSAASKKRERAPISLQKRRELISMAEQPGLTVKEAAKRAHVNYSTAKHIVKAYRTSGQVESLAERKRMVKQARLRELWMKKQFRVQRVPTFSIGAY